MRILLDHDVPHDLRPAFPEEYDVETAEYRGWAAYADEELLEAAEAEFSVLITLDTSLVHQQNVATRDIGIILLDVHPIVPDHLLEYMGEVESVLPIAGKKRRTVIIRENDTILLPAGESS